jgi:hypothetical protein
VTVCKIHGLLTIFIGCFKNSVVNSQMVGKWHLLCAYPFGVKCTNNEEYIDFY